MKAAIGPAALVLACGLAGLVTAGEERCFLGEYSISEVTIESDRRGLRDTGDHIRISGTGTGVRERRHAGGREVERFTVTPEIVFEVLKVAYANRFFDLKPSYSRPPQISLGSDGRIETSVTAQPPLSTRTFTIRAGDCVKSVSWFRDPESPLPAEVAFLVAAVDSITESALKRASNPDSLDPLPPWGSWGYSALLGAIPIDDEQFWKRYAVPWPVTLDSVRILGSYATESTPEYHAQTLLWFRVLDAERKPIWGLELAADYGRRGWHPAIVTDAPWSPIRIFKTRPTNRDIDELLNDPSSPWLFKTHRGDPLTRGNVRGYTWRAVMGEAPTERYYLNR